MEICYNTAESLFFYRRKENIPTKSFNFRNDSLEYHPTSLKTHFFPPFFTPGSNAALSYCFFLPVLLYLPTLSVPPPAFYNLLTRFNNDIFHIHISTIRSAVACLTQHDCSSSIVQSQLFRPLTQILNGRSIQKNTITLESVTGLYSALLIQN